MGTQPLLPQTHSHIYMFSFTFSNHHWENRRTNPPSKYISGKHTRKGTPTSCSQCSSWNYHRGRGTSPPLLPTSIQIHTLFIVVPRRGTSLRRWSQLSLSQYIREKESGEQIDQLLRSGQKGTTTVDNEPNLLLHGSPKGSMKPLYLVVYQRGGQHVLCNPNTSITKRTGGDHQWELTVQHLSFEESKASTGVQFHRLNSELPWKEPQQRIRNLALVLHSVPKWTSIFHRQPLTQSHTWIHNTYVIF